jgi:tetratricopeptide (TPR) repeat protein
LKWRKKVMNTENETIKKSIEFFNRGNLEKLLTNYDIAITYFNRSIELNPNFAEAFYKRGNVKFIIDDFKGALSDYDEAIRLNPKLAEAYHNRGLIKFNNGDKENGRTDFTIAAKLGCFKAYDVRKGYCN